MKEFKIIIAVILIVASTYTIITSYDEFYQEELYGAILGYVMILLIASGLIYSSQYKRIKEENRLKEEQTRHINTKETTMDVQHSEELNFQKQKENLKNLHEKGLLSEKELQEKNLKVTNQELTVELQKTEEYQQLSELYKAKVLESREFEEKVENLKLILKEAKSKNSQTTQEYQSKYNIIGEFVEGFAMVWDEEGNYGFIDYEDNLIITPRFEFAEDFKEELALVRLNRQFGFIDKEGQIRIPTTYDDAESFSGGKARVNKGKDFFYINKEGDRI